MGEMGELLDPATAIRAHLARFGRPLVDLETFGTAEPEAMAAMVDAFCRERLGAGVAGYLFCHASQGSTHGVALEDGRRVVVKLHAPKRHPDDRRLESEGLEAVQRATAHLHAGGFACPKPLLGPTPLARALATVEEHLDVGVRGDGFEPACRRAIVRGLLEIGARLAPLRNELPGLHVFFQPSERRYPIPHSPIFDFEATAATAGWIDAIADRARARSVHAGRVVVGHADWRVEHLRFDGDRIVASYDWDSILPLPETQLVGITAASYTTDWSSYAGGRVPDVEAVLAFVDDYEAQRGERFSRDERAAALAMSVYTAAYGARCQHALAPEQGPPDWPEGSWPALLRAAEDLLQRPRAPRR